jgi:hypothetical protein
MFNKYQKMDDRSISQLEYVRNRDKSIQRGGSILNHLLYA